MGGMKIVCRTDDERHSKIERRIWAGPDNSWRWTMFHDIMYSAIKKTNYKLCSASKMATDFEDHGPKGIEVSSEKIHANMSASKSTRVKDEL